ncbi:TatD family hydrolase [Millisia brevis]|uniref:TatD family hydrolase n=1 Tax=Millisia brevis TaxID=264148 RepID=UPI000830D489|nr:TatD family hydrolase [Millisia brevis]
MSKRKPPPPDPERLAPLIDSHTHIDSGGNRTPEQVARVLDRASAVGVGAVVTVACDMAQARWVVDAAHWDERVYAATAVHPTDVDELDDAHRAELARLAADPRVVAIGETGLDWYWLGKREGVAEPDTQREAFAWHIDLAKRLNKPLMIHNREADDDLLDVLRAEGAPETVVMHCFSSGPAMAKTCLDAGWILSFAGNATFRNALDLREAVASAPIDRILVETDAPYMTPHPYRGTTNESYVLPYTVRGIAELRGENPEDLAEATTRTARSIFGIEP